MIKNSIEVLGASSSAMSSMMIRRNVLPARSWRAEFVCRFTQKMIGQSLDKPDQWLRDSQKLMAMRGPALRSVDSRVTRIANVDCLECTPKALAEQKDDLPTMVYFHGGGYVIGSPKSYHYTLAKLAVMCQVRVIAVDYSLAPESPLPTAQQECLAVVEDLIAGASPQAHIYLAGDSAGGGLVLNTLRELKQLGRAGAVDGALLLSPWVRPFAPEILDHDNASVDILNEQILSHWVNCFGDNLSEAQRVTDFSETSFIGFPPMYIQAGGVEVFKPQIDDLVKRLRADRVQTSYDVFPDMFHVFQTMAPIVPEAERALALIAKKMERLA